MKMPIYTVALPLLAVFAFAQDTPPSQTPSQPSSQPSKAEAQTKSTQAAATMPDTTGKGGPAQMKTQTYSGTLMDASCAGGGTSAASSSSSTSSTTSSSADRTANDQSSSAGSGSCNLSASSSQFALKMKDGKVVRLDDVGNLRVQEAMKMHKKWTEGGKPVHVKASGVMSGDQLTVVSIN